MSLNRMAVTVLTVLYYYGGSAAWMVQQNTPIFDRAHFVDQFAGTALTFRGEPDRPFPARGPNSGRRSRGQVCSPRRAKPQFVLDSVVQCCILVT